MRCLKVYIFSSFFCINYSFIINYGFERNDPAWWMTFVKFLTTNTFLAWITTENSQRTIVTNMNHASE